MMRVADVDGAIAYAEKNMTKEAATAVKFALAKALSFDIVRCFECKHRDDCDRQAVVRVYDPVLELYVPKYKSLSFCSAGERE